MKGTSSNNGLGFSDLTGSWFSSWFLGDHVTCVVIEDSCWASQMNAGRVEYNFFLPTFIDRPLFHDSGHEYTYPHQRCNSFSGFLSYSSYGILLSLLVDRFNWLSTLGLFIIFLTRFQKASYISALDIISEYCLSISVCLSLFVVIWWNVKFALWVRLIALAYIPIFIPQAILRTLYVILLFPVAQLGLS